MVMWLKHIDQLDPPYKSYGSINSAGVIWGHRGLKVMFTKNTKTPTDYMPWSCDSYILISYIPSTNVLGQEIHPGLFGVTGVKGKFHQKCNISCRLHDMVKCRMYIDQLDTLRKLWSRNLHGVIRDDWGQKVIFTKNIFLLHITWYGYVTHANSSAKRTLEKFWV